ncbi:MAG: formate/nitrite transporter family protein [Selenomonadaceae bacterium]|nr:formate/nitrite transporter family protein [Selenomonadaceae bacterium]
MKEKSFVDELSQEERRAIKENHPIQPQLIFKIIRTEGEEELRRKFVALAFSALAAGIFVSFSFFFRSVFHFHMGDSQFEPLISSFGYTVGFVIVILGRMQLFTENPITTIIPLLCNFTGKEFFKVVRLWSIVFFFNIIGTSIAATFFSFNYAVSPEFENAMHEVARNVMRLDAIENIFRGIPAGIIIAVLVWIAPQTRNFRLSTIIFLVYFIALGDFSHVVVGSCEMAFEIIEGDANFFDYFFKFLIPTGIGNVIGGTVIFTLLIHNQVREELMKS